MKNTKLDFVREPHLHAITLIYIWFRCVYNDVRLFSHMALRRLILCIVRVKL